MGRERVLGQLRKIGNICIACGILLAVVCGFMTLIFIPDGFSVPLILFFVFFMGGVAAIIGGMNYKKGENSRYAKKHPKILELADTLIRPVFENDFVIISDKAIANKKNYLGIAALDEVLCIYEHITRTNGIVTGHTVQLCIADGRDLQINVYARKRETKDDLVLTISNYCPNARVGFSHENNAYIYEKRKQYKLENEKK